MIRIAITPTHIADNECQYLSCVFDAGWDWLHIRHPLASESDMRQLLDHIDSKCLPRVKLHSHPQLIEEYGLGGVHLNARMPSTTLDHQRYSISRSCHSIGELTMESNRNLDYVTLSPIFDSVSKAGYRAAFSDAQLNDLPSQPRVIALGGVTPQHIDRLCRHKFAGYAVLGYLAQAESPDDLTRLLNQFNK